MESHFENSAAEGHEPEKKRPFQSYALGLGLAFFFAAAAFFSGMQVGASVENNNQASLASFFFPNRTEENVDMTLFFQVWNTLEDRYVNVGTSTEATDEEHIWGAIEGLVRSYGDPYTIYLPPQEAEIFEADISGNFGGVGMEVGMRDGFITVIAPLPESPAEKADIRTGDVVVKINDEPTEGMSVDEAVSKIRGEKGTEVHLTLYREGVEEFLEKNIVRDIISIPTLQTEVKDDVFVIHLFNFSQTSEALVEKALREFVVSGKDKLVLDLRGNPGGYLQSAVGIASYFLPTGKIVARENFGDGREEHIYRSAGKLLNKFFTPKIVVLVDGGSASASEILAGALKEHGAATVIGTHTFGKGSVQELVELPDGSSLKVTIARWLTPNGISISNGGLAPDIEVEVTQEDRDKGIDPQLDAAIEYLNKE